MQTTLTHNRFVGMFAFVLGASVLWGVISPDSPPPGAPVVEEVQVALLPSFLDVLESPGPNTRGRVWQPWHLDKARSIGHAQGVGDASATMVDPNGHLFVLDRDDGLVKKFDPSYRVDVTYGDGVDHTPTSFAVGPMGEVWTSDPNDRIRLFDTSGDIASSWPRRSRGLEIALLGDRLIVFTAPTPDNLKRDGLFTAHTLNGERVRGFGFLFEEQERNWIAGVGRIMPDDDGEYFLYVAQYGGLLARFDVNGKLDYAVRTVDSHLSLPTVEHLEGGATRLANGPVVALNVDGYDGRLYVLTRLTSNAGVERFVVDVYNESDGSYLYTHEAPEPCSRITVSGESVYTSGRGGLTEWRFSKAADPS